ncbi:MAG: tRNA (adenosine(37)-N6)-threonylcarbamoyltransferase complex dimerization subunit type 1 TsaB [Planctomycetaceae bacterium]|nr:tRNA (adenosine(37)-N6)-threonylcarbamoyltransferase complex dimerization subunit type 1 TsaB [Planctomycetaceae bacterium]
MIVLGIETSGRQGSLAVVRDGNVIAERELSATGRRHARTLVPELKTLLEDNGLNPSDLDIIAVSIGPGSFTGLRVGVVCAKTLAYALNKPIVAIDTCDAIAFALPADINRAAVIFDALRGDVYVAEYERTNSGWNETARPGLVPLEAWLATTTGKSLTATGPGLTQHGDEISTHCPLAPEEFHNPQASAIALLGEQQAQAGSVADTWTIEPHYIRRSAAEEKADLKS